MYIREKSVVTIILWLLVCGAIVAITVAGSVFTDPTPIGFFLAVAAMFATRFIWKSTDSIEALMREQMQQEINHYQQNTGSTSQKIKRDGASRVGQLLDHLDDDEIEDLRNRLQTWDDDGAASFDELLAQRRRNQS